VVEAAGETGADTPRKVILKMARQRGFFGLPMAWLGRRLCRHEVSMLDRLAGLTNVPTVISRYGDLGFVYPYIEGKSLAETPHIPQGFFDELLALLRRLHEKGVVYLDMNKRTNILVGADKKPYLIDFQISTHIGQHGSVLRWLTEWIRRSCQQADMYHLFKHKRRLCPESLRPEERELSYCNSRLIKLHRLIANPLRWARRHVLRYLEGSESDLIEHG
jgi:hypothetical protein